MIRRRIPTGINTPTVNREHGTVNHTQVSLMNKEEITIVAVLFALLLAWGYFYRPQAVPARGTGMEDYGAASTSAVAEAVSSDALIRNASETTTHPDVNERIEGAALEAQGSESTRILSEKKILLSNDKAGVTFSSWGGAIACVELKEYKATLDKESGPVRLDFGEQPALSLIDLPGLSTNDDFELSVTTDGKSASIKRTTAAGLRLERTVAMGDDYRLQITDAFSNLSGNSITVPAHGIWIGPMRIMESNTMSGGVSYLGLDTLAEQSGNEVAHWGEKFDSLFGHRRSFLSCRGPDMSQMPPKMSHRLDIPLTWGAAKNKFFVQILEPEKGASGCELHAARDMSASSGFVIASVWTRMLFDEMTLDPGSSFSRRMGYYVGPKKYSSLKKLGNHQADVMQFGWWGWFRDLCKALLWTLTAIHDVIPNYGVAIILLTMIVRAIFWPITRKSTESMKNMQKIQPLVAELRKKYKDKPQKMNQEIMALYKEHKANPMAGCLPILLQMPVFIGLFIVLRSAIELRFAEFLWICDLSEPERLFAETLPIPLNILPIFMAATMFWQQKLTPAGGDPQQQKIMLVVMPVFMLFVLYNMASALVLYWSVSQCLSIAGLLIKVRKKTAPA